MSEENYILEMHNIKKHFGAVVALSNGYIRAKSGSVTALVGGNGAGKSTLIKILSGAQPADSGEIIFDGKRVSFRKPNDAIDAGIKTIYQELALIEPFTVTKNMFVGRELYLKNPLIRWLRIMDMKQMTDYVKSEIKRMDLNIPNTEAIVRSMSGGQRQAIAIAKALMGEEPKVLILDEPTAALGVKEANEIKELIKKYRDAGAAIILISHNMRTVFELADEITVMRLGETIANVKADSVTEEEIVALMTGAMDRIDRERDLLPF